MPSMAWVPPADWGGQNGPGDGGEGMWGVSVVDFCGLPVESKHM